MTPTKRRGASVPLPRQQPMSPTSPPPTQALARPRSGGRHRPCFVSMATGGAGPAPSITRCGKHAPRGIPPASPAPGRGLKGPRAVQATCRFARHPQGQPGRTRPISPRPATLWGVWGSPLRPGVSTGRDVSTLRGAPGREPFPPSGAVSG